MALSLPTYSRFGATVMALGALITGALAEGTFIPAASRADHVYDAARHQLYISNGSQILRYDVLTKSSLPPITVGGTLQGLDISPDGTTLAVADADQTEGPRVHFVNLDTAAVTKKVFARDFYEAGTHSVAYAADGSILVSSNFNGSGSVPLRRFDPNNGSVATLAYVSQRTMLSPSADRQIIGFAEPNNSSGPFGRYRSEDRDIIRTSGYDQGTSWFNFEIGTNRDGTQFALPTYGGTFIADFDLTKTGVVLGDYAGPQPVGAAYHPAKDVVYFPWAGTEEVRVFNSVTWEQIGSIDAEYAFGHTGNAAYGAGRVKVSSDGTLVSVSVGGGVRLVSLESAPLEVQSQSVITSEDTQIGITLTSSGAQGAVAYEIVGQPGKGTVSGSGDSLVYTPNPNANGSDSFTFRAVDEAGRVSNEATVSIEILPVNDNPVAADDSARTKKNVAIVINVLANDTDLDGDTLKVAYVTAGANGTITVNANGTLTFTPKKNFFGTERFSYTITDLKGGASTATAWVTVTVDKK